MPDQTRSVPGPVGSLLAGFYGWMATVFFGAILLDVVYAHALRQAFDSGQTATVFSEASDFLLLLLALTVMGAIGAIASAWNAKPTRNLFAISALLVIAQPFGPVILGPLALDAHTGTWIRLLLSASASILGILGLGRFNRGM